MSVLGEVRTENYEQFSEADLSQRKLATM